MPRLTADPIADHARAESVRGRVGPVGVAPAGVGPHCQVERERVYSVYMAPLPTDQRILAAAWKLFAAGGIDAVSLRQVAAKVDVTPMAIYRHFAGKDALIDALVVDALDRWSARLAKIDIDDPLEWLTAAGDEFLEFALEEPRRFEAAFLVPSTAARRFPDDFAAGRSPAGRQFLPRLEALHSQGRLTPDAEPLEIVITFWALAQGLVTLHRAERLAGGVAEFRSLYRRSMRRCIASFVVEPTARTVRKRTR
jgi:AcrR family transcriptional regulator